MRTLVLLLIPILTACGTAADTNRCEIAVTGDTTATIKAESRAGSLQGKVGPSTDYWLSDDQVRRAVSMMHNLNSNLTAAEKQRRIDESMTKDPRLMLLLINCMADEGGIIFGTSNGSKYADVPFQPASYTIGGKGPSKPGEFTAAFQLSPVGKLEGYSISEPGELVLTQFDRKGLVGTFSFKAHQFGTTPNRVTVAGSFHFPCVGGACQK